MDPSRSDPVPDASSFDWSTIFAIGIIVFSALYWYFKSSRPSQAPPRIIAPSSIPKRPQKPTEPEPEGSVPLKIYFGSQTGTAEEFANTLAKEARRYQFRPRVIDLEDFDGDELESGGDSTIFVVATYGEGEPTDNAKEFYSWLMSADRASDAFKSLSFTVFGLGNKTYEHYNAIARKVDSRLEELQATRLFRRGEGDDDANLEDDFAAWKRELWPVLCGRHGLDASKAAADVVERKYRVEWFVVSTPEAEQARRGLNGHLVNNRVFAPGAPRPAGGYDVKHPYVAPIVDNRELHAKSSRSCRHVEIDIGKHLTYQPGDHLGVYPENDPQLVARLAARLKVELDAVFALYPLSPPGARVPFLGPLTVRQVLSQRCDFLGVPRKSLLRLLAHYTTDPAEKQQLTLWGDDSKAQPYQRKVKDEHRSLQQILDDFPSCQVPFDAFVEAVPALAPRYYSISSAPAVHRGRVHVTSVVVEFETLGGRRHFGVCSSWYARLAAPESGARASVPVFVRKSEFHLPRDPSVPVLLIGPGTGIAPLRGFLHERRRLRNEGTTVGDTVLFFGCRSRHEDFLYEHELLEMQNEGFLKLFVAFSRDQPHKVYVQHQLEEQADLVWSVLHGHSGYVFVCGDARQMAKDVRQALVKIASTAGSLPLEQAERYISDLVVAKRYCEDTWQ